MNLQPGQWYITALGRRVEILGVDSVRVDGEDDEVIAYRYDGKEMVHMRTVDLATEWRLEGELRVGDRIRSKMIVAGVRIGGAERKVITYISDRLVCYDVFAFDGRHLSEHALSCTQFYADFERIPE